MTDFTMHLLLVAAASYYVTWMFQRDAERKGQTKPDAGFAIVLVFTGALLILTIREMLPPHALMAMLGGCALPLSRILKVNPPVRLAAQAGAAIWLLAWVGGMPPLHLGFTVIEWGIIGHGVGFALILAMINLYRRMDTTEGLAGGETVIIGLIGGVLVVNLAGGSAEGEIVWMLASVLAVSCVGFFFWNWNPARVLMGVLGSEFIGYAFAALMLISAQSQAQAPDVGVSLWIWIILLGVFIVDVAVTTLRRDPSLVHQKLRSRWKSSQQLTRAVILVDILWLGLWALSTSLAPQFALVFTLIALLPLLLIALFLKAKPTP